jgi:hypothetical protein
MEKIKEWKKRHGNIIKKFCILAVPKRLFCAIDIKLEERKQITNSPLTLFSTLYYLIQNIRTELIGCHPRHEDLPYRTQRKYAYNSTVLCTKRQEDKRNYAVSFRNV